MRLFPVHAEAIEPLFPVRKDHPVPRQGIERSGNSKALDTNKFYANMFLGDRTQSVWIHPYSVWWSNESENWGLAVSHVEANQRTYGPDPNANPVHFYFNPIRTQSICLSAVEFGPSTAEMRLGHLEHMSARVSFHLLSEPARQISSPLIQGSGFITALYHNLIPRFGSKIRFRSVDAVKCERTIYSWRVTLEDGHVWKLYAFHLEHHHGPLRLVWKSDSRLEFEHAFTGAIQIAKVPLDCGNFESVMDNCAGTWATDVHLSAKCDEKFLISASYTFQYRLHSRSRSNNLLMWALPHHVQSFCDPTISCVERNSRLQSTTKGLMTAIVSDTWHMREQLPEAISFSIPSAVVDESARTVIYRVAQVEAQGDPAGESNQSSMYFSGKALDKFACLCWVISEVLRDISLAQILLAKVKDAFSRFADNRQRFPLVYEKAWGGLVSSAMYETGNLMEDFGNGCYNDHHFHYGYFIHAAAVIAKIDQLLGNGSLWFVRNRPFVDHLLRDTCNANPSDAYFPLSRAFDWFHGHSWAKGLFDSWDGKDEESTSEDAYYSYAVKLWGAVTGDKALERRAELMLAIQKRVFSNYFLMEGTNPNQPPNFLRNKVTGILFENKCDHTTYFGNDIRFIQGIHMIPLSPVSHYTRSPKFIQEEWEQYFSQDASTGDDGWKGVLYANYSIVNPQAAWNFFASDQFRVAWLDGGASRTWYLWLCKVHEAQAR